MRYSLRNKEKIIKAYDKKLLDRMVKSLDKEFKSGKQINEYPSGDDRFKMILVSDIGHTVNEFAFYIINKKYDVYNLAFKEIIG